MYWTGIGAGITDNCSTTARLSGSSRRNRASTASTTVDGIVSAGAASTSVR
jgi:hypothetical protein